MALKLLALALFGLALIGCDRVFVDPATGAICTVSDVSEFGSAITCEVAR